MVASSSFTQTNPILERTAAAQLVPAIGIDWWQVASAAAAFHLAGSRFGGLARFGNITHLMLPPQQLQWLKQQYSDLQHSIQQVRATTKDRVMIGQQARRERKKGRGQLKKQEMHRMQNATRSSPSKLRVLNLSS